MERRGQEEDSLITQGRNSVQESSGGVVQMKISLEICRDNLNIQAIAITFPHFDSIVARTSYYFL